MHPPANVRVLSEIFNSVQCIEVEARLALIDYRRENVQAAINRSLLS